MTDPRYVAYGKIHIDNIQQVSQTTSFLGGGGPQTAYGMRLWSDQVGFLTRSGKDIPPRFEAQLQELDIDLGGWKRFDDLPTPQINLVYDENERMIDAGIVDREAWLTMMRTPIPLPPTYRSLRAIHLVTEWADTAMVTTAHELQAEGAVFSLEPLLDNEEWFDKTAMMDLIHTVNCVTPDFPSASRIADQKDPLAVLRYWSQIGPDLVAIRDGARGSYVWSKPENVYWHVPPLPVENVVDPTGAGNAYGGGMCVGWVETQDARTAAAYGTIAAYSLLHIAGLPSVHAENVQATKQFLQQVIDNAVVLGS